jgi:pimeloyl-ACP methyl ester carboxylesterase
MKKIYYFFLLCWASFMFLPMNYVQAETNIGFSFLGKDTVWDKGGSPYVLSDTVTVPSGVTLTIGPGVTIVKNAIKSFYPTIDVEGGSLYINGKGQERVTIDGIWGIDIVNGAAHIANTDIKSINDLSFENSTGDIATTTISTSTTPLHIKNSKVKVWGSRVTDNKYGIDVVFPGNPVLMMQNDPDFGIGGMGNALEDDTVPLLDISNSVIANNKSYGLMNLDSSTILAVNNWWGSADGPATQGPNKISGLINYEPWLTSEPPLDPGKKEIPCCSSILFLPGLEGSYLYRPESLPLGLGTITNTLWPPNRNDDARKLFLDANGSGTDPTIYSGDPIGKVYGIYGVYDKFMTFLDGLAKNGTVNEWKSFAYDWRKPIAEVVAGPEKKATTTDYLVKDIENLASRSKTGKVTLIGHSNGGLVAKYLVKTLEDMGKANLIDSVISVAVPYLGTPQAIAAILHGDSQSIAYGLFLKESVAKQLGQNMASAYSLLPSKEYFSRILSPTIAFASMTAPESYNDQYSFIAKNANQLLLNAADVWRSVIDPYVWPAAIAKWAIVGWNKITAKGVSYSQDNEHSILETEKGDGTVIAPSAAYNAGTIESLDLEGVSKAENRNIKHGNILESSTTQAVIREIIGNGNESPDKVAMTIPNVTRGEPAYSDNNSLVVSAHSPVELHVYDQKGNHTGLISPPAGVEDDIVAAYEENIPGSTFLRMGENGSSYVYLPDDGSKYSVVAQGTGVGAFTLDIERKNEGAVLDHVEYANLPVIPLTVATTTVEVAPFGSSPVSSLASSSKPLQIDINGDGSSDIQAIPGTTTSVSNFNSANYLEALKKTVIALLGDTNKAKSLNKRIDRLEDLARKGKDKKVRNFAEKLANRIGHKKMKGLKEADKQQIIDLIDVFIAQYE